MNSPKIVIGSDVIDLNDYDCKVKPKWSPDFIIHTSVITGKKTLVNRADDGYGRFECEITIYQSDSAFDDLAIDNEVDFYLYADDDIHFDCLVKDLQPFVSGGKHRLQRNIKITLVGKEYVLNPLRCTAPAILPPSKNFPAGTSVTVTITSVTSGSIIYYTKDGTDPDDNSTEYTGSFEVSETTTVKAIVYRDGMHESEISSETYTKVIT